MIKEAKTPMYGIAAIVVSIGSIFVPQLFLVLTLIVAAVLIILGLIKGPYRILSIIAALICGYTISLILTQAQREKEIQDYKTYLENFSYQITYKVICNACTIRYTNSEGMEEVVFDAPTQWSAQVRVKGKDKIYLSASTSYETGVAHVEIYSGGNLIAKKTGEGRYATARLSLYPKDYANASL